MASIIEKIEDHYRICDNLKNEADLNYYHEDASWTDLEKVKIFFFKNPYLDKETNIYDIYIKDSEERVGCIFPITAIESEDVKSNYLKNYLFLAFKALIEKIDIVDASKVLVSEYYDDNLFILVLHKETLEKLDSDFCINNYIFSFASYGFYYLDDLNKLESFMVYKAYEIDYFDYSKKKLKIADSVYPIIEKEQYIHSLFSELLRTDTNLLSRFILLYQVIELEIGKEQQEKIKLALDDFNHNRIQVNDLKERIGEASKEKSNIQSLFDKYIIEKIIKDNFYSECTSLFNDVKFSYRDDWCSIFYSLRNNLVHSYSNYIANKEALSRTILAFEKVIINLIIKIHT